MGARAGVEHLVHTWGAARFAFLAGSGISVAAGLPSGGAFNNELATYLASPKGGKRLRDALITGQQSGSSKGVRFEQVVQTLRDVVDPELHIVDIYDAPRSPADLHIFLADALAKGADVLTTNFDSLIEEAYITKYPRRRLNQIIYDVSRKDRAPRSLVSFRRYLREGSTAPSYFKLHGSIREMESARALISRAGKRSINSIRATLDTIGAQSRAWGLEKHKEGVLRAILAKRPLMVLGYSGLDDFDVNPSLCRVARGCPALIWIFHEQGARTRYYQIRQASVPPEFPRALLPIPFDHKVPTYLVTGDTARIVAQLFGKRSQTNPARRPKETFPRLSTDVLPNLKPYSSMTIAQKDTISGRILEQAGDWTGAATVFRRVLESRSSNYRKANRRVVAQALSGLGRISVTRGDLKSGLSYFRRAIRLLKAETDLSPTAGAVSNIASIYMSQGRLADALRLYLRSGRLYLRAGNAVGRALVLGNMGICYARRGDWTRGAASLRKALVLNRRHLNRDGIARDLGNLGNLYRERERYGQAIRMYTQANELNRELGRTVGRAVQLCNLAIVYRLTKRLGKARAAATEALDLNRRARRREGIARSLSALGSICRDEGNLPTATRYFKKALHINERIGAREGVAEDWENLGDVFMRRGMRKKAVAAYRTSLRWYRRVPHRSKIAEVRKCLEAIEKDRIDRWAD